MPRIIEVIHDHEAQNPWTWLSRYDDRVWLNPVDFDADGNIILHVMVEDDDIDIGWIEHHLGLEPDVYSIQILAQVS